MRSLSMQALLPAIDCGQQNCIIWLRNGSLMISWEIFNLKSCHLAPTSPKHALSRHLRKWRWRTAGVLSQEIPYCLSDKEAHRRRKPVQILWNLGIQDSSRLVVSWHTARNRWLFFVTYPELMGWTKTDVWIEPWRLNSEKPEKPICWRGSQISRDKNILLLGVWRVHLCVCVCFSTFKVKCCGECFLPSHSNHFQMGLGQNSRFHPDKGSKPWWNLRTDCTPWQRHLLQVCSASG